MKNADMPAQDVKGWQPIETAPGSAEDWALRAAALVSRTASRPSP